MLEAGLHNLSETSVQRRFLTPKPQLQPLGAALPDRGRRPQPRGARGRAPRRARSARCSAWPATCGCPRTPTPPRWPSSWPTTGRAAASARCWWTSSRRGRRARGDPALHGDDVERQRRRPPPVREALTPRRGTPPRQRDRAGLRPGGVATSWRWRSCRRCTRPAGWRRRRFGVRHARGRQRWPGGEATEAHTARQNLAAGSRWRGSRHGRAHSPHGGGDGQALCARPRSRSRRSGGGSQRPPVPTPARASSSSRPSSSP